MVILAGAIGALAGVTGTIISDRLSAPGRSVPTGPTIVLVATALVLLSFLAHLRFRRTVLTAPPLPAEGSR